MAKCEQCGAEFSNWFGDVKHRCPKCEQQAAAPQQPPPQVLLPDGTLSPAPVQRTLPAPIVTRILIGINVAVFLAMVLLTRQFVEFDTPTALRWGADYGPATASGEWWRMLTSMFLHGGILHILVNMFALRNLGYTAELFYGRKNFLIIYMLSGFGGSAATLLWRPDSVSVGASGAIFGVAGALAAMVYFKKLPVDRALLKRDIGSIGAVIFYNLLIGAALPIINNAAHVGGLVAGAILGFTLPAMIFRTEREKSNSSGTIAIGIVIALIVAIGITGHQKLAAEEELYRADKAYEAGKKSEALQHLERAAAMHPETFTANFMIGAIYLDEGQPEKAVPFLEKAVQLQPENRAAKQALDRARNSLNK
ncbi:Rhomboid-like protein [Candidatus Koribacter versatilis Ellin345]|uniref:Rhomboid-like protein n=1 Tax=Koribacter versatilis (strain Ellin345) TaxID=204669 RepID=Q1IQG8_KORVE|nr:rhomboid family intramembrane serine protease [Candidatus Koribacter versatilis]ABF40882.1 Rhomboid-like protein [Candidatus Koribacter versatilis Ellin345]